MHILYLFVIIFSLSCKEQKVNVEKLPDKIELTENVVEQVPVSEDLMDLSLFFSGKLKVAPGHELSTHVNSHSYQLFKNQITKHWREYTGQILHPLQKWREFNVPHPSSRVVFYPFSGPDFPNAYSIYPEADTFILAGLEAGGLEPEPELLPKDKVERGLKEFAGSLDSISRLNFFLTNKMKKDISASIFRGTAPVFLAYFGLMGIKPCSLKPISLKENGEIHYLTTDEIKSNKKYKDGFVSLELIFNDPITGKNKFLYYFSKDLSNNGLNKDDSILKFVQTKGAFSSTFKAASFLLHYNHFSRFRDFIIQNVEMIVMDDTGPRVKDLKEKFEIRVFGVYTQPIKLWPRMVQAELRQLHSEQKPSKLPFKYGYGTSNRTYHLMVVTRKKNASKRIERKIQKHSP